MNTTKETRIKFYGESGGPIHSSALNFSSDGSRFTTSSTVNLGTSSTTGADLYSYSDPELLDYRILEDVVEFVYKQVKTPMFSTLLGNGPVSEIIVYKIVVSWKDGKTQVHRVEGKYIHPADESYTFEDQQS